MTGVELQALTKAYIVAIRDATPEDASVTEALAGLGGMVQAVLEELHDRDRAIGWIDYLRARFPDG